MHFLFVVKTIVRGMRVNCTQIYSINLYLDFYSALACVKRNIRFEGSDLS